MKTTMIAAAFALAFASTATLAAPAVEITILGAQTTSPSHFRGNNDNVPGASNDIDRVERELGLNSKHLSSDFAPGLRLGVRLGDSPVILTVGARQSDHLDLSYDAGVRYNQIGSAFGVEARAVRFDESDVRAAFGDHSVEGELVATYDVAKYVRLGAGVSSATVSSSDVVGLVTADLVFKFGGQSAPTAAAALTPTFPMPVVEPKAPVTPIEKVTGERG